MSFTVPDPAPHARNSVRVPFLAVIGAIALLAFLIRLNPTGSALESCTPAQLALQHGRLCRTNDGALFTGHVVEHYPGGQMKSRMAVVQGLPEGLAESWHTNGQLQATETFHGGVSDGVRTKWHPSGAKLSESTLVHGKMQGLFRAWHENGQLAEEVSMKDDQPSGEARAWYPSGFLKAAIGTNLSGQVEHHNWRDGECRSWPGPAGASP